LGKDCSFEKIVPVVQVTNSGVDSTTKFTLNVVSDVGASVNAAVFQDFSSAIVNGNASNY
jgi:hypothetical protein